VRDRLHTAFRVSTLGFRLVLAPTCDIYTQQEDLLERAALVGRELRETAEGLAVLKHEVSALRESIRQVFTLREVDMQVRCLCCWNHVLPSWTSLRTCIE